VNWILGQFSEKGSKAQEAYKKFVSEGRGIKLWDQLEGGIFLGSEGFVDQMKLHLDEKVPDKEIPRSQRLAARPSLAQLFSEAGQSKEARNLLIYQAIHDHGYTLKEVGNFLGLHYSTVSKIAKSVKKMPKFNGRPRVILCCSKGHLDNLLFNWRRNRLIMLFQALQIASDGIFDILYGLLSGPPLRDAARQSRTLSDKHSVLILLNDNPILHPDFDT